MSEFNKFINQFTLDQLKSLNQFHFRKSSNCKDSSEFNLNDLLILITERIITNRRDINFIMLIIMKYIVSFSNEFSIHDMLKTIESRAHFYRDSNETLNELSYLMLDSLIKKEFSAQLLLKFAYKSLECKN